MENNNSKDIPKLLLLDIYDTILDMSEIEKRVNGFLDSKRGYALWFELFLQYTFADNCIGKFHDFSSIAGATLQMAAEMMDEKISPDQLTEILELMKHLPVQDGVQRGLSGLSDHGFRIAALTNSPEQIVTERMKKSGLISYFEQVFSAEKIRKYKPASEVYLWASHQLKLNTGQILLVSSHSWDIAGAENAGMRTAFLHKRKQMLYPLAPSPNFTCKSLADLCEQLALLSGNGQSENA